jgi:transposase
MPKVSKLCLIGEQVEELTTARDHHSKAYVREKAAGILKVSQGESVRQVALHGLHKRRSEHTVKGWIESYLSEGIAGLVVKRGRGRKPAFFPPQPAGGTGS